MKNKKSGKKKTVEQRILGAIKTLLTGRVKEILFGDENPIPRSENGDYCGLDTVVQAILVNEYRCTEKDRILGLRNYHAKIGFTLFDTPETKLYFYAYNLAVCGALYENPTLGKVAEIAYVTSYKFIPPRSFGDGWKMTLTLRVVVKAGKEQ